MKLCKDCKFYEAVTVPRHVQFHINHWFGLRKEEIYQEEYIEHNCKQQNIDPVTGENRPWFNSPCGWRRENMKDSCGPDGKLWEVK